MGRARRVDHPRARRAVADRHDRDGIRGRGHDRRHTDPHVRPLRAGVGRRRRGGGARPADAASTIDLDAVAEAARSHGARVVWLSDPNNPTGGVVSPDDWSQFLDRLPPACAVVADEAYIDFADPALRADRIRDVVDGRPVIMLRSFSKTYGLAGLRLGFAIADPEVARLLDIVQEPFNVNRVALAAGRAAVALPGFVETRRAEVAAARELLRRAADRARAVHASVAGQLPAGQPGHGRRPGLRAAAARGRADPRWNRVRAARLRPDHRGARAGHAAHRRAGGGGRAAAGMSSSQEHPRRSSRLAGMGLLDASATLRWNGYLGQIEGDSGDLSVATATQAELGGPGGSAA